ncbi:MAG: D-glycero-beta-D-manno-heptose-7-phosphate kinase [Oligoflexia bacterium]|nr:D-glycero-beta-D-manno-heptose-7-phosphate kinase [Oligoflexia bacterium]
MKKKNKAKGFSFREIRPVEWERGRLRDILRRKMRMRRVLVVGDVGVDRYTIGSVERISPEAPVPIVLVEEEQLKLGLAANVADNVQALGGVPLLLGVVGDDRIVHDFKKLLRATRISAQHLVTDGKRRTVLKERIVSDRQQLLRVDYETIGPLSSHTESQVLKTFKNLLKDCDVVVIEDYHKGLLSLDLAASLISAARKAGKCVAIDPNAKTPLAWYEGATLLTPNTREAESLSGIKIRDENTLAEAGFFILDETSAEHVVITRGKEGMALFSAGSRTIELIPTYAREVYDVSGAGDTVISVLALALSGGANISEAAIIGNLAAGVEVGKRGTATVTPDEVEMALDFFAGARAF